MRKRNGSRNAFAFGVVLVGVVVASGCAGRHAIIAMSSTTIGVVVHQNEKQQTPEMKLGYNREEFAYVPTNRSGDMNATSSNSLSNGAADTGNVLMELRGGGSIGLSAVGQGEIYQRLAVGDIAVQQRGAAFMMAKDASGNLDPTAATAVASSFALKSDIVKSKLPLTAAYAKAKKDETKRKQFKAVAQEFGYDDFDQFAMDPNTMPEVVEKIRAKLTELGLLSP